MKKWKILNDSDKSSNSSKNSKPIKQQNSNTIHNEPKSYSKPYVPLKRSKGTNSFTHMKTSKNQITIPNLSHKYIKAIQLRTPSVKSSKKVKTQQFDIFELGMNTLENIQNAQKSGINFSERLSSDIQKTKKQPNWFQRQATQRHFVKQGFTQDQIKFKQINSGWTPFTKKPSQIKLQNLKKDLKTLHKQNEKLKQTFNRQIKLFNSQIQEQKNKWRVEFQKFIQSNQRKQEDKNFSQKFIQQYSKYRPKIEELQQQKQVFLQTLIRMSPL